MTAKIWQNVALLFVTVCVIGQVSGQVLTPAHREENAKARREQQILMNIRQEVAAMVQTVREETIRPALASYSTQIYELAESVANISSTFANISAKIEEFREDIKNGSVQLSCPDSSWVIHDKRCYYFSVDSASWSRAKVACQALGSILAETPTAAINDVLKAEARRRGGTYWIGGHDISVESRWEWDSTGARIGYMDWGPDQPNNVRVGQDCLELLAKFQWEWNDRECTNSQPYICETGVRYRRPAHT